MEFDQFLQNVQSSDLQWLIPVVAGVAVVIGGLLIGLVRGMTAGVIIALFFGGLMCLSPALLDVIQQRTGGAVISATSDVAESAADLAELNNDVIEELSRVVTTMRTALDGIAPTLGGAEGADTAVADRFGQGLSDTEARLDTAIDMLTRSRALRDELQSNLDSLESAGAGALQ